MTNYKINNLVENTIDLQIKAHQKTIVQLSIEIEKLERQKNKFDKGLNTLFEAPISDRLETCLRNAGFEYLEEAYLFYDEHGVNSLLRLKNFGRKSLNELMDLFKEYGYMD